MTDEQDRRQREGEELAEAKRNRAQAELDRWMEWLRNEEAYARPPTA